MITGKLKEMNPFANVELVSQEGIEEKVKSGGYTLFIYGFRTFAEAIRLNNLCREACLPFYALNTSGLFGFYYADVGKQLTFTHQKKKEGIDVTEEHTIANSKTLEDYLAVFDPEFVT